MVIRIDVVRGACAELFFSFTNLILVALYCLHTSDLEADYFNLRHVYQFVKDHSTLFLKKDGMRLFACFFYIHAFFLLVV